MFRASLLSPCLLVGVILSAPVVTAPIAAATVAAAPVVAATVVAAPVVTAKVPEERLVTTPVLLAIPGSLSPAAQRVVVKTLDFYGDFGGVALGEGDADDVSELLRHGVAAFDLGPWPAEGELLVVRADARAPDGARLLLELPELSVFAISPGLLEADTHAGHACTVHGRSLVKRVPWVPAPAFQAPDAAYAALAADDRIAPLVAQVSGANISATVTQLSGYFTRRADSAQILDAQAWLLAQLAALPALSVSTHAFGGGFAPNVVAELTGTVHPERVVVLGAHLDSINGSGSTQPAPGADDNASGSGGLLEAARILSTQSFEHTIRFVWFSAEEFGLVGADAYAADLAAAPGIEPIGMLNMDMIAHRDAGDALDLDLATNSTDPSLTQFAIDVAAAYVPSLPVVTGVLTAGSSDHAAFQAHGIPAAFFFEDLDHYSAVIHTSADTQGSSANDYVLAERIGQVFVATAAEMAQPVDLGLDHAALVDTTDASGPYPVEVAVTQLGADAPAAGELRWRLDDGPWQTRPLLPGNIAGTWVGSLPGLPPDAGSGQLEYYAVVTDAGGHAEWIPDGLQAGADTHSFFVGSAAIIAGTDFEAAGDEGWTHQQLATQDDWQHDEPGGLSGDPPVAASGNRVWGNDLGLSGFNGAYQPNVSNVLVSPSFNTLGQSDVHLRFARWLTVEDAIYDQATVRVNGTQVWRNPQGSGSDHLIDTSWTPIDLDVSALADDQASVVLRFELQSDGGLEFGGWNLDDVALLSVGPGTTASLAASHAHLSAAAGGTIDYAIDAGPANAGRTYLVLLTLSGTAPGTTVHGVHLPLEFDAMTDLGISLLFTPTVPGFTGTLDAGGRASASLVAPPLPIPGVPGLTLHAVALTMQPITWASVAAPVTFIP